MTEHTVHISITIKVEEKVIVIEKKVRNTEIEEDVQEIGQEGPKGVIDVINAQIAANVPASWRNVGTEECWMVSSWGAMRYKRRVYLDGDIPPGSQPADLVGQDTHKPQSHTACGLWIWKLHRRG